MTTTEGVERLVERRPPAETARLSKRRDVRHHSLSQTNKGVSEWVILCFEPSHASTKDYIRVEHRLHSISKLFISQVITPRVIRCFLSFLNFKEKLFQPFYIPRALNTGTCIQHPSLLCGSTREPILAAANTGTKAQTTKWWNLSNIPRWAGLTTFTVSLLLLNFSFFSAKISAFNSHASQNNY